jgi:hypothetical protein
LDTSLDKEFSMTTSPKLNKNWSAICQIEDHNFRLFICGVTDPAILGGLQRGFPELFTPAEQPGPFPASFIRDRAEAISRTPQGGWGKYAAIDRENWWTPALVELGVPYCSFNENEDQPQPVPPEILAQLVGQKIGAGMRVEYKGASWVVTQFDTHSSEFAVERILGTILAKETIDQHGDTLYLSLCPAELIDLDK